MSNAQKLAAIQLEIDAMPSYEHALQYGEGKEWRKKIQRLMYKREALISAGLFQVVYIGGNPKCPADVIFAGLTRDDAEARSDRLNRETRGALGRYAVRAQ